MRLVWGALALIGAGVGLWRGDAAVSDWVGLLTLAAWCLTETMMRRNWLALLTLPAMLLGIGCALPLYLFIRSRKVL
ncbi:MAG: DUF2834 domain-containing protein [Paracoccus sp. (in: a-proteobacteria)]|uniref:DUF2834 domain-containing protein n=1 Tax=Paracoccus sp. TaxID=267 RepID=UPI0026DF5D3E|nr:DUF2834 domain-containing protein [Paracoccus sp. (in: a-proteobacteria)]MDO5621839.1 DUF2834 domain-containing protein [Paracoccus sp. (in: a-proteobacteria)]